jgi:Ni/Co efflux regulator RcnB
MRRSAMTLLAVLSLTLPAAAFADPEGRGGPGGRGDGHDNYYGGQHREERGGPGGPGRGGPGWGGPGGGGREWHRGERFDGWREPGYRIREWRRYRGLYAPPPGYYWVQYGNQFLLTAIATGVIAGVVSGLAAPGVVAPVAPGPYPSGPYPSGPYPY